MGGAVVVAEAVGEDGVVEGMAGDELPEPVGLPAGTSVTLQPIPAPIAARATKPATNAKT